MKNTIQTQFSYFNFSFFIIQVFLTFMTCNLVMTNSSENLCRIYKDSNILFEGVQYDTENDTESGPKTKILILENHNKNKKEISEIKINDHEVDLMNIHEREYTNLFDSYYTKNYFIFRCEGIDKHINLLKIFECKQTLDKNKTEYSSDSTKFKYDNPHPYKVLLVSNSNMTNEYSQILSMYIFYEESELHMDQIEYKMNIIERDLLFSGETKSFDFIVKNECLFPNDNMDSNDKQLPSKEYTNFHLFNSSYASQINFTKSISIDNQEIYLDYPIKLNVFKPYSFLDSILTNQAQYLKIFSKILFVVMVVVLYN